MRTELNAMCAPEIQAVCNLAYARSLRTCNMLEIRFRVLLTEGGAEWFELLHYAALLRTIILTRGRRTSTWEVTGALVSLDSGVVALHGPVYSAPSALTANWMGRLWGV